MNSPKNSRGRSLGEWLVNEELAPYEGYSAVFWPREFTHAVSLLNGGGASSVDVISPSAISDDLEEWPYISQYRLDTHEFSENGELYDMEYGMAMASDTASGIDEGMSRREAIGRTLETSNRLLLPGGAAIYNLNGVNTHERIPYPEGLEADERLELYVSDLEEGLSDLYGWSQEELDENTRFFEQPDFQERSPHFYWRKPE